MASHDVNFLTFFIIWARVQGWKVPLLHVRICQWLEHCDAPERVLMVFRGAAKSTIYAVFKAWKLYRDVTRRSLVWSADGPTAEMLTADVINVLRNHPLTAHLLGGRKPGKKRFWVNGAKDARNASMRAVGVDSNATGARADDVDFDDVEVPGNIETPEARAKLRHRISDSTHILVPGGQATYIGTPHTTDSIYPEQIAGGAAVLKIPLFEHSIRYTETDKRTRYKVLFEPGADGLYVMTGIHKGARMLVDGRDYRMERGEVVFSAPPGAVLDICTGCAWPDRFDRSEIELRRKKTRTLNAWDSQYMLEAKPIGEIRLDPSKMRLYDVEPTFRTINGEPTMWLGKTQIVSASLRWDPSGGKVNSDVSALCLILQDVLGNLYWHRAVGLTGPTAKISDDGRIEGGQVWEIADLMQELGLTRCKIETNGVGTNAPDLLRGALKARRIPAAAVGEHEVRNKNKAILGAFDGPLSSGLLWAHVSVMEVVEDQMRDWNPAVQQQPDDYLDAGAKAIADEPVRVGRVPGTVGKQTRAHRDDWRPAAGTHEMTVILSE